MNLTFIIQSRGGLFILDILYTHLKAEGKSHNPSQEVSSYSLFHHKALTVRLITFSKVRVITHP